MTMCDHSASSDSSHQYANIILVFKLLSSCAVGVLCCTCWHNHPAVPTMLPIQHFCGVASFPVIVSDTPDHPNPVVKQCLEFVVGML